MGPGGVICSSNSSTWLFRALGRRHHPAGILHYVILLTYLPLTVVMARFVKYMKGTALLLLKFADAASPSLRPPSPLPSPNGLRLHVHVTDLGRRLVTLRLECIEEVSPSCELIVTRRTVAFRLLLHLPCIAMRMSPFLE